MTPAKSSIDPSLPALAPVFAPPTSPEAESAPLQAIIAKLGLQPHIEGGYFVETDRDRLRVPNPFQRSLGEASTAAGDTAAEEEEEDTRSASTSIHYLLGPGSPLGAFHRNRGRTVHTLHRGRGRYVIIHADEVASARFPAGYGAGEAGADGVTERERWTGKARVETFVVGQDVLRGERLQWIVEGGKYKCSFLLPDDERGGGSEGLLISETVVPGFEYADHDFMRAERMDALVTEEQRREMDWMLRKVG